MDTINSAFLKLTYSEVSDNKLLFDVGDTYSGVTRYYQLKGSSSSSAHFEPFGAYQTGYKVVSPETVVFVVFFDHTTCIVLDGKFYAKVTSAPTPSQPIKVIQQGGLPNESLDFQDYSEGDVVMAYSTLNDSGVSYAIDDFVIAICSKVDSYEDSGTMHYSYTWLEVAHFPLSKTEQSSMS
jgi:hypothetical protein